MDFRRSWSTGNFSHCGGQSLPRCGKLGFRVWFPRLEARRFALWRAKFAAGNAESSVSAACGFPGRTRADQLSKLIDGSIARAAAGMRAHLLLARLCLSLLVGPLHAINARYKMCELVCAETPGMRWVLPCFIASSNVRVRTGNCEVNLLTE